MRNIFLILLIFLSCLLLVFFVYHEDPKEVKFSTYVINLDRAPEKLTNMKSLLDMHLLEFERIRAVDGYEIDITDKETGEVFKGKDLKNGKAKLKDIHEYYIDCGRDKGINYIHNTKSLKLSAGEMGCICSHRLAYFNLLQSENDYTVIFEDDLKILNKEFLFLLHSALNNMPKNSVVYIDAWGPDTEDIQRNNGTGNLFIKLEKGPNIFGTYALIIDKIAAKLLLSEIIQYRPIDITIGKEIVKKTISGYLFNKRTVSVYRDSESDITKMGRGH
jgi:glycosyl transferase family 25